jgi:hypothetical protein
MGKTLSMDLRSHAIEAVDSGTSCKAPAGHFGTAPSTVICSRSLQIVTTSFEPGRRGRMAACILDANRDLVLSIWEASVGPTLMEMCVRMADVRRAALAHGPSPRPLQANDLGGRLAHERHCRTYYASQSH